MGEIVGIELSMEGVAVGASVLGASVVGAAVDGRADGFRARTAADGCAECVCDDTDDGLAVYALVVAALLLGAMLGAMDGYSVRSASGCRQYTSLPSSKTA